MGDRQNTSMDTSHKFQRALVVGTVRNASNRVVPDLLRIVNALEQIMPTSAFVVESDSTDATPAKLLSLSERDARFRFISIGNIEPLIPDRIARLRHCRNYYIDEIRENVLYEDCDLIVVADLDGINTSISEAAFRVALNSHVDWDVLTANQSGRYYDLLALRHPFWSPNNCFLEMEWLTPLMGRESAWQHSTGDRMLRIPRDMPPIRVDSAFGGLALYKRWIFEDFNYSEDIAEANDEIDHVTLHRKARVSGAKIFIHPGLINSRWTAHGLNGVRFIHQSKRIAQVFPLRIFLPILRRLAELVTRKS